MLRPVSAPQPQFQGYHAFIYQGSRTRSILRYAYLTGQVLRNGLQQELGQEVTLPEIPTDFLYLPLSSSTASRTPPAEGYSFWAEMPSYPEGGEQKEDYNTCLMTLYVPEEYDQKMRKVSEKVHNPANPNRWLMCVGAYYMGYLLPGPHVRSAQEAADHFKAVYEKSPDHRNKIRRDGFSESSGGPSTG